MGWFLIWGFGSDIIPETDLNWMQINSIKKSKKRPSAHNPKKENILLTEHDKYSAKLY